MLDSIGGYGQSASAGLGKLVTKLDANSDNSISRSEFVTGRPQGQSEEQAGSLFDTFDSSSSGSLSQNDLLSAFQQMAASMASVLIQAQSDQGADGGRAQGPPDASQMFSELDVDGDGSVTREEFLAGRPDDVSESQASAFFDKLAGADAASLTEEQLAAGLEQAGPPPSGASQTASTDEAVDSQALAQSLLQQFMQAVSSYQESAYRGAGASMLQTASLTA
jgi:Ca2+-binding EF-hand superfamily protein